MKDKIKKIIKREFNAKTLKIKRITDGYSHFMYEVKIDKKPYIMIVRFSNNTKEDVNLSKEKYIMKLLEKHKIPVPKIYSFNKNCMIMEKLQGIRLDTLWKSLSKNEKLNITKKIGRLLKDIHKINLERFGRIEQYGKINSDIGFEFRKMGEKSPYSPFLREWLKDHFKDFSRLMSYPHVSKEFAITFLNYIMKNLDKINYSGKPILVHTDLMTGHIFVEKIKDEYEITGIIDFEFARSYSPEYDFIKLHRQGFFKDPELKKALEKGYGTINEEVVEIHRIARDLGFAWAMVESGNKKLSDKVLKELEKKIKKKLKISKD